MATDESSRLALAAVVYGPGAGAAADAVLADVAGRLQSAGLRLAGAVQQNEARLDRCRCDMALRDLATGRVIPISEDRGPLARGCHLDARALEEAVGLSVAAVARGADLLIVNRFGKREADGHGFRQAIAAAISRGVPVVVAVAEENVAHWNAFAAGCGETMPLDGGAIADWAFEQSCAGHRGDAGRCAATA